MNRKKEVDDQRLLDSASDSTQYGSVDIKEPRTPGQIETEKRQSDENLDNRPEKVLEENGSYTVAEVIGAIGFGRSQIILIAITFFVPFGEIGEIMLMPILSTRLYAEMGLTPKMESLLASASFFGFAIGYPFWGVVADRVGRKPALIFTHCWILLWGIMSAAAPSISWLIAFRIMYSLAGGTLGLLFPLYQEFLAPEHRRIAYIICCGIGTVSGKILPIALALPLLDNEDGSWRCFLLLLLIPFVIFIPLAALFLDESPRFLMNQGKITESKRVLRKIAARNEKQLPETFALVDTVEIGDVKPSSKTEDFSFWDYVIETMLDRAILRGFLCFLAMGLAAKFALLGTSFVKTEFIFKQGGDGSYCEYSGENDRHYLKTEDYLKLLMSSTIEFLSILLIIPLLLCEVSVRNTNLAAYGVSWITTLFLYFCPQLILALVIITIENIAITAASLIQLIGLSGILPTKVRATLFGLANFIMYLTLPATPYLTQHLAKWSQYYFTSVNLAFMTLGFIGALLIPRKLVVN